MLSMALAWTAGCADPPQSDDQLPGPAATAATLATAAWAASVDADSARAAPVRCDVAPEIAQGALVFVQRPNDSSTRIVADFRGPGGRALENYYAMSDTVRLFVRVDERYANPLSVLPANRTTDSLWFAEGRVARWVDSVGRSHALSRQSVGARAENAQRYYNNWLRAIRDCR